MADQGHAEPYKLTQPEARHLEEHIEAGVNILQNTMVVGKGYVRWGKKMKTEDVGKKVKKGEREKNGLKTHI